MFFITLPLLNVALFSKSPYRSVHREINYEAGHTERFYQEYRINNE